MKYRNFGKLDFRTSALGFGAMRLPTINHDDGKIDQEKAIEMIRYAIDHGVNYLDTAWSYHQENSEILVGKALKDGYRARVKLATKLPSWLIKEQGDLDKYLEQQLEKLATNYIDFYLLHTLNKKRWEILNQLNIFDWIASKIAEGKIKYIGFSFHDNLSLFKEIIDAYNWDFCQIQYNYLDIETQAGQEGLKYAAAQGIAVIIMEPLLGGTLAGQQPPAIQEIWDNSGVNRTPADWALQWLWNQEEVALVLSGMSTLEQVKENVLSASNLGINTLSKHEVKVIELVREKYQELSPLSCSGCSYCLPCPTGVAIPYIFSLYNEANIFDKFMEKQKEYHSIPKQAQATSCISCAVCEGICPQNLQISALMEQVKGYFQK